MEILHLMLQSGEAERPQTIGLVGQLKHGPKSGG